MKKEGIKDLYITILVIVLLLSVGFNAGNVVAKVLIDRRIEKLEEKNIAIEEHYKDLNYSRQQMESLLPEIIMNIEAICKELGIKYKKLHNIKKND